MIDFNFNNMLFKIDKDNHDIDSITRILNMHPEIKFVSLVGIDIAGHDTDEKIPVKMFLDDIENMMNSGVQTDGSSVFLPKIADLNNAKVDIKPDKDVNWYVDYNFHNIDNETELPIGTLRIPSHLVHNDTLEVGSRVILRNSVEFVKKELLNLLKDNSYLFDDLDIEKFSDIDDIVLTSATELEFWVNTPEKKTSAEKLHTAQMLKEQYWKRTIGPVRSALEKTLLILDEYGFEMEMGHKEVGGIKAKLAHSGNFDRIMEQLEIDWKYSDALQAADNENQVKYVVKDIFRNYGLDVTFMAKPIANVAGSGEHTHVGIAAKLKDGSVVNLFSPIDTRKDFLNPLGFGALLGILKNYEVMNPFISSSNDAFNRLKPGYEAPVSPVTSLGHSADKPSRNRTVLIGLVREIENAKATRFELRSPNPKSNTYLVLASCYLAMLDGIKEAVKAKKTSEDLLKSLSKNKGDKDFYLDTDRQYRTEKDIFEAYTPEERRSLFGIVPKTVWENIKGFNSDKVEILFQEGIFDKLTLESYKESIITSWATELHDRILPSNMDFIRKCIKLHGEDATDYDIKNWEEIQKLRVYIGKNSLGESCLLSKIREALDSKDYETASKLQLEMQENMKLLRKMYINYKQNLF